MHMSCFLLPQTNVSSMWSSPSNQWKALSKGWPLKNNRLPPIQTSAPSWLLANLADCGLANLSNCTIALAQTHTCVCTCKQTHSY